MIKETIFGHDICNLTVFFKQNKLCKYGMACMLGCFKSTILYSRMALKVWEFAEPNGSISSKGPCRLDDF